MTSLGGLGALGPQVRAHGAHAVCWLDAGRADPQEDTSTNPKTCKHHFYHLLPVLFRRKTITHVHMCSSPSLGCKLEVHAGILSPVDGECQVITSFHIATSTAPADSTVSSIFEASLEHVLFWVKTQGR